MFTLTLALLLAQSRPYPLNQEMQGSLSDSRSRVETTCKVVQRGNEYVYMYHIANKGKKDIRFNWQAIDRALTRGELILDIKANDSITVTLVHKDPPITYYPCKMTYWTLSDREEMKDYDKQLADQGIHVSYSFRSYYLSATGGAPAPLPKSFDPNRKPEEE